MDHAVPLCQCISDHTCGATKPSAHSALQMLDMSLPIPSPGIAGQWITVTEDQDGIFQLCCCCCCCCILTLDNMSWYTAHASIRCKPSIGVCKLCQSGPSFPRRFSKPQQLAASTNASSGLVAGSSCVHITPGTGHVAGSCSATILPQVPGPLKLRAMVMRAMQKRWHACQHVVGTDVLS